MDDTSVNVLSLILVAKNRYGFLYIILLLFGTRIFWYNTSTIPMSSLVWYDNCQADNVPEQQRASRFGILSGISSCSFVSGNLLTRFLPSIASIFQVITLNFYGIFFIEFNKRKKRKEIVEKDLITYRVPSLKKMERKVNILSF